MVRNRTAQIQGLNVFYREAGRSGEAEAAPARRLPASSHQFRNLILALADRFHVLSPDYPGFGNTDMPEDFEYTFDRLSEVVEGLLEQTGFYPFGLYHQDYGGPIGNRIVGRHPDWLEWQVIELERLRGGLHRRLGRHPARALGEPQPRNRGAARALPRARRGQARLHTRTPRS